jgi:hypothetical protein
LLRERDPRLAGELIRMLNDETENLTWRNYCVQFLRSSYEQDQQPEVLKALEDTCRHKLPELSSCAEAAIDLDICAAHWRPRFRVHIS